MKKQKIMSCILMTIFAILAVALMANEVIASYQRTADNTVPAYTDRNLTNRIGNERVDKGDRVTVFEETDKAYYVRYPVANGTKDRWVPKNIFNGGGGTNTAALSDGWYRIQPMHDLSRSFDALGTQIGNGNNIHMWTSFDDALQQKFYLQNRGNGYFSLQTAYGNKLFVTADGNNGGANLYTSDWKNSDSQLFKLINIGNGYYYVMAKVGNNLIFDCAGGGKSDGTNVGLWYKDNDVDWYKWKFTPVSVPMTSNDSGFDWPIPGRYTITTAYTYRSGKAHSSRYYYQGRACGIDISAPIGTEVRAAAAGTVVNLADKGNTSFGKWIEIRHEDGTCTVYAHLSAFRVSNGQRVNKGDLIALSGNSGNSSGPHLHFEMSNHDTYQYFKSKGVI